MRTLTLCVTREQDGRQIKSLLKNELCFSADGISRLKRRESGVLLNGAPAYVTRCVRVGDVLTARIDDEPNGSERVLPIELPLSILFEDDDLLVIDKPAGLSIHPARDESEVTLENAVAYHLGGRITPHPVSRLDRGTTGLITFAKSAYIHERLRRAQHTSAFERVYLGVAIGSVSPASGTIDAPIGFAEGSRYKRAVAQAGQSAQTVFETLHHENGLTLLKLCPRTGRTHQIRVHMAHLGFPLAGDWLYGAEDRDLIARPALHAYTLSFLHPVTGERLCLRAPLPADLRALVPNAPLA